jgi:IS30 family transposase
VGTILKHLSIEEREYISILLAQGKTQREIGRTLNRNHTTICRELKHNTPPINKGYYLAHKAQERATQRLIETHKRPRLKNAQIKDYVTRKLKLGWSPEQISGRISTDCPGQYIGYEAIYQYIYEDEPGLIKYLPRSHRKRYPRGHSHRHSRSHIPERTPLDERPIDVERRDTIGHWEGDTMVSRKSKVALQVLIERRTRFAQLTKLDRKTAAEMTNAAISRLGVLPAEARQTLTLDNGSENTEHLTITDVLGTKTYFCAPFHSWEKGSVENMAGLVRRFFPKKTDFALITHKQIESVESLLNNRPRKCLNYATPMEVLSGAITGGM